MNTKLSRLAGIFLILSMLLAACAQATPPVAPQSNEAPVAVNAPNDPLKTDQPIDIAIRGYSWQMTGLTGVVASQARAWAAQYPNVKLDIQIVDDWSSILANDIAAGSAPDIVYYEGSAAVPLIQAGQVLDISSWYDMAELKADFIPDYWNNFMAQDGKLYAIYQDTESRGVYYRADLIKEADLMAPQNGWTYEDMRALAQKLTTPEVAGACIGTEVYYELAMAAAGGFQYGKDFGYDNPGVRELFQFYQNLIADGSTPENQAGLTRQQCYDLFAAGKVAMTFLHAHFVTNDLRNGKFTPDNLGFVSLPAPNSGAEFKSVGGGFMWIAVKKDYDPVKLAFVKDLFLYVTSVNSQTEYMLANGTMSPRLSVMKNISDKIANDKSLATDPLATYWPIWLKIGEHNIAPQPQDPNNWVWVSGLVQGVQALQVGGSVDDGVKAATDYFNTNKK